MKILLTILFLAFSVFGQANIGDSIDYKLKIIPQNDRTTFEISVKFKAKKETKIKLPPGCYGTPDLYKYVLSFEGEKGTRVKNAEKITEKTITPNKRG